MIMKILAVVGIIAVMSILQIAEYKSYGFDYKTIPRGLIRYLSLAFKVYLIWVWLGTIC